MKSIGQQISLWEKCIMQILSRILSLWIMASLQELYSRGGNRVWKKHNTLAPSDFRVYAKPSCIFRVKEDLPQTSEKPLTQHSLVHCRHLPTLTLLRSVHCSGSGPGLAQTRLPAPFVFPIAPDLFLFLIWTCLALRKTYNLASAFMDEGIHPKEAIKPFSQ